MSRSRFLCLLGFPFALCIAGCSVTDLVNNAQLPTDQRDPNAIKTRDGAVSLYTATLIDFANAIGGRQASDSTLATSTAAEAGSYVYVTGLLTDELQTIPSSTTIFPVNGDALLDSRTIATSVQSGQNPGFYDAPYRRLQMVRGGAREGRGALRKYASDAPQALVAHLLAIEGMADVLLAEFYCSGIPLSTLDFEGDYTPKAGSESGRVYQEAIALFDSALALASDSARILNFARVGKGRALVNLGEYAAAAQAVAEVPTDYQYRASFATTRRSSFVIAVSGSTWSWTVSMGHREGGVGLPYVDRDPRTVADSFGATGYTRQFYFPLKYAQPTLPRRAEGDLAVVVASGIEARLIEAEAALSAKNPTWLTTLNTLRTTSTTCTESTTPCTAAAGSGLIGGLPLLNDRATDSLRVALLFKERAYWLYLTGHRQGDLRRLIRQYKRDPEGVYPTGLWGPALLSPYGRSVSVPVPPAEKKTNALYAGCITDEA